MDVALALLGFLAGVALIVWGAEIFAEYLGSASPRWPFRRDGSIDVAGGCSSRATRCLWPW